MGRVWVSLGTVHVFHAVEVIHRALGQQQAETAFAGAPSANTEAKALRSS